MPAGIVSKQQLLEVLARGLRFPDYFGYNWDALWDCLRDFHWMTERRVVIVHEELPTLLEHDLVIYLELLNDAVADWQPDEDHELVVVFPESVRAVIESLTSDRD